METKYRRKSENTRCYVNESVNLSFGIIIDLYVFIRKKIHVESKKLRNHGNFKTS